MTCDLCGESGPEPVGPISALSSDDQALWESAKHRYPATNICRVCWLQFVISQAIRYLTKADNALTSQVPSWSRFNREPFPSEAMATSEVEEAICLLGNVFGFDYKPLEKAPPTFPRCSSTFRTLHGQTIPCDLDRGHSGTHANGLTIDADGSVIEGERWDAEHEAVPA